MKQGLIKDRRVDWGQHYPMDRRYGFDRRCGLDRRGSGLTNPTTEPRPYGFRSFTDRRRSQERRSMDWDADGWDRRTGPLDNGALELTSEEILVLLHQPDDE